MRVLIAHSDATLRDAFLGALEQADISVVSAADRETTLKLARLHRPDVVLLEDELPGLDGASMLVALAREVPDSVVVVITGRYEIERAVRLVLAGAAGYLSREVAPAALPRVVRGVVRGEAATSRTLTRALLTELGALARNGVGMRPIRSPLTPREWEVLDLMTTGASTEEISHELVVSIETVQSHIKHVLRKLQVHSRSAAIARAAELRRYRPERAED